MLIISAGGDTQDYGPPSRIANIIFHQMNTILIGSVRTIHTNEKPANEDTEALGTAKELSLKLNQLHNLSY
ncbi:MAG: hypothetical protein H7Y18_13415 [Clostridiaceae bacterium]|nr:hypothetical protein [Clostridiaceae bacterium]